MKTKGKNMKNLLFSSFLFLTSSILYAATIDQRDVNVSYSAIGTTVQTQEFGDVSVGESKTIRLSFTNDEAEDLNNCGIVGPSAPFSYSSVTCGDWAQPRNPDPYTVILSASNGSTCEVDITYTPTDNTESTGSARLYCNDASYNGNTRPSFTIDLTGNEAPANLAPEITSNGGGDTASISVAENQTAVTTVTATDTDSDTITYTISGGADSASFSIDNGVLTFTTAPDFETKTTYVVEVTATDDSSGTLSDTQTITVSITDVDENTTLVHSIDTNGTITNATYDESIDVNVTQNDNGYISQYETNETILSIESTTNGNSSNSITLKEDNITTTFTSEIAGSSSMIDEDGNITSTITSGGLSYKVMINLDGTTSYEIKDGDDLISSLSLPFTGGNTTLKANGEFESIFTFHSYNGFTLGVNTLTFTIVNDIINLNASLANSTVSKTILFEVANVQISMDEFTLDMLHPTTKGDMVITTDVVANIGVSKVYLNDSKLFNAESNSNLLIKLGDDDLEQVIETIEIGSKESTNE